jgi:hypothetical protein
LKNNVSIEVLKEMYGGKFKISEKIWSMEFGKVKDNMYLHLVHCQKLIYIFSQLCRSFGDRVWQFYLGCHAT